MILIISESLEPTTNEICKWLNFYNVKWFRINEEDCVRIEKIEISNEKIEFILKLNNESFIKYSDITFVYYRRGIINLELPSENIPDNLRNFLLQERLNMIEFLHSRLELKSSLGKFEKHGANKLNVLAKAVEVGLEIPTSYIVTEIELVKKIMGNDSYITKAIFEAISFKEENVGYSNPTSEVDILQIPDHTQQLFPSLIQKNIPKDYEVRTIFIDGAFFSMAILSNSNLKTKIDYRNYDSTLPNRNIPIEIPIEIKNKLTKLMKVLDYNFGCIDMIYHNKEYYFLEINPVGQFGVLSEKCGYNLEKVIAEKIVSKWKGN